MTHSSFQSPVEPEPAASDTVPCGSIIAPLGKHHGRPDAKFAELDEARFACEDRVLKLEPSLAKSTSGKPELRTHVSAIQTNQATTRANLIASQLSIATSASELDGLRADN